MEDDPKTYRYKKPGWFFFVGSIVAVGVAVILTATYACVPQIRIGFVTRSGTSVQVRVAGADDGEPDVIVTRFACWGPFRLSHCGIAW